MRSDQYRNKSLHYFNSFAVKDRIPLNQLSLSHQRRLPRQCDLPSVILPTTSDDAELKKNFTVLVSRVISSNMPFFNKGFRDVIDWHINHPYHKEMSKKSDVVSYFYHNNT